MINKNNVKNSILLSLGYIKSFLFWTVLSLIVGAVSGVIGGAFAKSISCVTDLREQNGWLLFLLPFVGILSVFIYKLCRVSDIGTNQVFRAVQSENKVPFLLAPAVFIGSVFTHLCGGSAGKEGAALQLGGSIAALLSKIFHLKENQRHILTLCGMAGLFSAVFGTPLGAAVFALEVVRVGHIYSVALFPTLISSLTAFGVSSRLGISAERFDSGTVSQYGLSIWWKVLLISVAGALVSIIFCRILHISEKLFKRYIKNAYFRIFAGGIIIIVLTLILNTTDYNGGGIHIIERIFAEGAVRPEAFLLKIIFTAVTVGAGFKGGEIVPTMFIGATLGGSMALLLGISPALGAAIGLSALFCGVTNCPLATLFLCMEMFGTNGILFIAVSTFVSFMLSGYCGLYTGQKLIFSKLDEAVIDRYTE